MRRFLHLIENEDGSPCCKWIELEPQDTMLDIMRTDIHCLYALPLGGPFTPDHCLDADEVRFLPEAV